jgi:hypothetical protein
MKTQPDSQLRNALVGLSEEISTQHQPPRASALWFRAQLRERQRSRQRVAERATLPLRIMSMLGLAVAILGVGLVLHQSGHAYARDVATMHASLLFLTASSVALIAIGGWLLLRIGNRESATEVQS